MNQHKLISSKALIAELYSDFNITMNDWVNKAQRHIARALEIMEINGYMELATCKKKVTDYIAHLPCDEKHILGVLTGEKNSMYRIPLTTDLRLGNKFQTLSLHEYKKAAINGSLLKTNFKDGYVTYVYYRYPLNKEGDLMIPDNAKVLEAIPYFIIYKLSLGGYKHPLIDFDTALQMWNNLYPQGRNSFNYPSLEEMQRFTEINTNPLVNHILEMGNEYLDDVQDVSSFATNLNIF